MKSKEEYAELAEGWAEQASRDRSGWDWKVAHATAIIALTYATLATTAPATTDWADS